MIINLLLILVIDLSGFVTNVKRLISKLLTRNKIDTTNFSIKPFDCSYCMTFWCLLIYLLITGNLSFLTLLLVIMITHFTEVTKQLMILVKDFILKLIDEFYDDLQIK